MVAQASTKSSESTRFQAIADGVRKGARVSLDAMTAEYNGVSVVVNGDKTTISAFNEKLKVLKTGDDVQVLTDTTLDYALNALRRQVDQIALRAGY